MTTIIYKDGVLASDSQVTLSTGKIISKKFKKIFEPEGCMFQNQVVLAYGLAGDAAARLVLERLLQEEGGLLAGDNLESEDDFEALIVCENSVYYVEKSADKTAIKAVEIDPKGDWCIGSGSSTAYYVLAKGGSVEKAMEEAAEFDAYTGGPINVWRKKS